MNFKTVADLNSQIEMISSAPKDSAPITKLCYRPGFGQRVYPDTLTLSVEDGVIGDRWKQAAWLRLENGVPDPRIQVCILPQRVLDLVWTQGSAEPYPGDTMIADMDTSYHNMPVGTILQAGSAQLQVSDVFNDGCTKWAARYGADSREWINLPQNRPLRLRGILCQIVSDGVVQLGDVLRKV
ncbi:MAG: hypothetical protein U5K75_03640 [Ahrensia sp.]|nr:hypothetical protein [Ahrensia sp.]